MRRVHSYLLDAPVLLRVFAATLAASCAVPLTARAQLPSMPSTTGGVSVSGIASLYADQYSIAGDNFNVTDRQPHQQLRMLFAPTITGRDWSLPITIDISTTQSNILTPAAKSQTVAQLLENPLNTVQVAPRYKWAQLVLGTYAPHLSDLTAGNMPVFGAAVDLTPGTWHVGAFGGTLQRAVDADPTTGVAGAYARRMYGGTVGYNVSGTSIVNVNVVSMNDEYTSAITFGLIPRAATAASISAVHDNGRLLLRGELAAGSFTSDTRPGAPDSVTRTRFAAFAFATYAERTWDVTAKARYLGDGFVPPGYYFEPTDALEFTVSPSGRLFDNRLVVNATLGLRTDNFSNTRPGTSSQMLTSINALGRIDSSWSASFSMTNYGLRIVGADSAPAMRTTSGAAMLAPRWTGSSSLGTHNITATIAFDHYDDQSINTGFVTANDTRNLALAYVLALAASPLSLRASVSQYLNHLSFGPLTVTTATVGAAQPLFDKLLDASADLAYAINATTGRGDDSQILFRFALVAHFSKNLEGTARGTLNLYTYGTPTGSMNVPTASFTEEYVRTSLSYRF